jgi:hypothetical protein
VQASVAIVDQLEPGADTAMTMSFLRRPGWSGIADTVALAYLLERSAQSDLGPDGSNSLRAAGVVTHGSPQFRGDDLADAAATVRPP